ncbi:MAG: DUF2065 domain-containing protein [Steroidobacteraceae bacterium]
MNLAWGDLLAAVAILLVLEGLLPFLKPDSARRFYQQLANLAQRDLRVAGFASMVAGVLLLFFVRYSK